MTKPGNETGGDQVVWEGPEKADKEVVEKTEKTKDAMEKLAENLKKETEKTKEVIKTNEEIENKEQKIKNETD